MAYKEFITGFLIFGSLFLAVCLSIGAGIWTYRATQDARKAVDRGVVVVIVFCSIVAFCGVVYGFTDLGR